MNIYLSNSGVRSVLRVFMFVTFLAASASALQAQNANFGGSRFFKTTITMHDQSLMAEVIFNDTEGNTIVQGAPLINVISKAYGLRAFQIVDGPDWIYTSRLYNIEAVPPPAFVESNEALMLQALLADRFGFEGIETSREMSVLVLELGGDSLELDAAADTGRGFGFRTFPLETGGLKMTATFTLDDLALLLSGEYGQPVINLTGLTGRYGFELKTAAGFSFPDRIITPYIMTKPLLEQAGLTVELKPTAIDVLVVSQIDHPELDD